MMNQFYSFLMKLPLFWRFNRTFYKMMGVRLGKNARISSYINLIGDYHYLDLKCNSEINSYVFLLARAPIVIGQNSTLAYGVSIITSANPNGPYNKLAHLYPAKTASVIIKNDVWIGANATILPGITIGSCSIVAAGAVVTKNVPDHVVVAGVPAKVVKRILL